MFERDAWRSAAELVTAVDAWRNALSAQQLRAGAVLGLQGPASLEVEACMLAAWQLRAIVALLPGARPDEATRDAYCELVLQGDAAGQAYLAWCEAHRAVPLLEALRAAGDAGVIIFTSGSSGRPRAAVHALSRLLGKYGEGGRALRRLAV